MEKEAPRGDYIFFEGPPTANNRPHIGHVLTRVVKDVFPRYRTMRGYRVRRKAGWDTHGLPVEIEIEKRLGLKDKRQIEELVPGDRFASIAKFNRLCKQSVLEYEQSWREVTERIGFWIDLDDPYFTFTNEYIESVWWILKQFYERGLLYKGHKILPYCPLCGTTHSSHEVAQNFKEDVPDPSIYVKFEVTDQRFITDGTPTYLLVWTTTPWTLLSNVAVAAHPDYDYIKVRVGEGEKEEHLILAKGLAEEVGLEKAEVVATYRGRELEGLTYRPLFPHIFEALANDPDSYRLGVEGREPVSPGQGFRVVIDDYVTLEEGTGLVHQAPAFGEDDYRIGVREKLPFVCAVGGDGRVKPAVAEGFKQDVARAVEEGRFDERFAAEYDLFGKFVKDFGVGEENTADPYIFSFLKFSGRTLEVPGKSGLRAYRHNYPFCWRHDTPLIYFATDSWFIRTTALKEELIRANRAIGWVPEHIKEGRMGDWLENVVDWALSRRRYWGTPLPIWVNDRTGEAVCVGSFEELFKLAGRQEEYEELKRSGRLYDPTAEGGFDPHRPYIDQFSWEDGQGGTWRRVEEVIDAWFDSGSVPYAQVHFPFEEESGPITRYWPADFISEAVDQTRGWFYTLHVISVFLSSQVEEVKDKAQQVRQELGLPQGSGVPAYKNCLVLGHILDEQGRKMSKRLGNVVEPTEILEEVGADALRWYLLSATQPWIPTRFSPRLLRESTQKVLIPLHNALSFFTIYADIDGFSPADTPKVELARRGYLDRWILIQLDRLKGELISHLDNFRLVEACQAVERFVDRLTNWYIRRSRDRFWKGEKDQDKWAAYWTLWEVLTTLARLIAPLTPFFAERLHQVLMRPFGGEDSVHLESYPEPEGLSEPELEEGMEAVLRVVELGRAVRASHKLKVRQPLRRATLVTRDEHLRELILPFRELVMEELNIKELAFAEDPDQFVHWEIKPNFKVLGKRLGKRVKEVAGKLSELPAAELKEELDEKGRITLALSDGEVELSPGELDIRIHEKEGTASQADRDLLLVLDTTLDEQLVREGLAREFVNRVQNLRKELDLEYTQRITLTVQAEGELRRAIEEHRDFVMGETLAVGLEFGDPAGAENLREFEIEGREIRVGMELEV